MSSTKGKTEMTQKVAFVSGSGRGIGRAIAIALAESGHAVAVGDLREPEGNETVELIRKAGGKALFVPLDVADSASVQAALKRAVDELGPVDVLVNNAGWDELKPFTDTNEAFWQKVVDINYLGTLRLIHAVLPGMLERKWGRIISISSDAARVGSSFEAVYSGAKGAIISFTKTLAREVARKGVTANSVCPGPTRTPGFESVVDPTNAKLLESMVKSVPLGRLGEPEDIAAAVVYLASERAGYVTGQTLSVSGGLTMA
ncbi:SDR family NAD(P)-dependent oxidoreductase [Aromatoleum toluvorans]|nr:3-oxoacyl-ACP reductase family protein [Aromatoleum toluvorans]